MTRTDDTPSDPAFRDVDAADAAELIAMMDATDAWPAVRAARSWIGSLVGDAVRCAVDVGSGPGSFNAGRAATLTVDVDRSVAMLRAARRRHGSSVALLGDAPHLALRDGAADLVHAERVLQWLDQPEAALAELVRVTAAGGWLVVTDTDWSTFRIDSTESAAWTEAALAWVPHATFAASLPSRLAQLDRDAAQHRHDRVVLREWDPGDPAQRGGPPGLPLRSIAASAADGGRRLLADLDRLAAAARAGSFRAELTLVTAAARRS
jgi:SAM-dependent methyltransferase